MIIVPHATALVNRSLGKSLREMIIQISFQANDGGMAGNHRSNGKRSIHWEIVVDSRSSGCIWSIGQVGLTSCRFIGFSERNDLGLK